MPEHFIHYLKREIILQFPKDPKNHFYSEVQDVKDGFDRPMYHITTRKSGAVTRIKENSVIWLFSTLKSPWGVLSPSLDAMFIVEKIEHLADGRIKYHADKSSRWYHMADASTLIDKLKTVDKNDKEILLRSDNKKPIGLYLQSIRQLSNPAEIIAWEDYVYKSDFHFVSYRIKDGTKPAFQKVKSLISEGKLVFWDRFSLPRRLAERRELIDSKVLNEYLMTKIKDSHQVWGIESKQYFSSDSYAQKEAVYSKKLEKYFSVQI